MSSQTECGPDTPGAVAARPPGSSPDMAQVDRAPAVAPRRAALALTAVLATQLMLQLDAQVVTVALPQVQGELGFSAAGLSWVPNAYALAFGGLMLLGGRLGDVVGRVRAFEAGTALFALASLAAGLAQDPTTMIIARVVQGMGAAVAAPSILSLITAMARDEAARRHGLAMFTATSAIGSSFGLILGGFLTAFASWRWGLLINVPVGILVVITVHRLVRETARSRGSIDVVGAATATTGSLALVYGFIHAAEAGWSSVWTVVSFALAIVLLVAFVLVERHVRRPLLDLSLLKHRARAAALVALGLIVGAHFAMLFLLVQYFQRVLGMGALVAGLAFLPLTLSVLGLTQFVPAFIRKVGAEKLLTLGSLLVAISFALFATLDTIPQEIALCVQHRCGAGLHPRHRDDHGRRRGRQDRFHVRIPADGAAGRRLPRDRRDRRRLRRRKRSRRVRPRAPPGVPCRRSDRRTRGARRPVRDDPLPAARRQCAHRGVSASSKNSTPDPSGARVKIRIIEIPLSKRPLREAPAHVLTEIGTVVGFGSGS